MKHLILAIVVIASFSSCWAGCSIGNTVNIPQNNEQKSNNDTTGTQMKIKIGSAVFTAKLNDNATAAAFRARLPMTINMTELNGNEKYFELPYKLPANSFNPGTIRDGDLMLYGSGTLVLFYKTFSTSYSYTRIGRIDNPSGLPAALGTGNVTVSFELE